MWPPDCPVKELKDWGRKKSSPNFCPWTAAACQGWPYWGNWTNGVVIVTHYVRALMFVTAALSSPLGMHLGKGYLLSLGLNQIGIARLSIKKIPPHLRVQLCTTWIVHPSVSVTKPDPTLPAEVLTLGFWFFFLKKRVKIFKPKAPAFFYFLSVQAAEGRGRAHSVMEGWRNWKRPLLWELEGLISLQELKWGLEEISLCSNEW